MALTTGVHCLEVTLNGQDFTDDCVQFLAAPTSSLASCSACVPREDTASAAKISLIPSKDPFTCPQRWKKIRNCDS